LKRRFEVIVVGGGIAGASLAYFLTRRGLTDVLVVEREEQPGYHATGRSAAALVEYNAIPLFRRLTLEGAVFLREPPEGFVETPLVEQVGVLLPGAGEGWEALQQTAAAMAGEGCVVEALSRSEVLDRVPVLVPGEVDGGLLLPRGGHLDVHALLSGYLRALGRAGGELRCRVEVQEVLVERGRCVGLDTSAGELRADLVVNAAGAWVGELGRMAGATPIAFSPKRRTIITFAAPAGLDVRAWPMVDFDHRQLYFKAESGGLLASPMDQQPMSPCDARPDEETVAEAVDRLQTLAPPLAPRALRRKWAGLRTFSPDLLPVVGPDPRLPGFFWLAGQAGCGIETSPALGQIAADLVVDRGTTRLDAAEITPARFR
jgi:D-arginine dehydrogenase